MSRERYLKAEALRRRAVILAAACAALGGIPAVTMTHGHRWIGFAAIAVQLILLVIAVNFYRQSMSLVSSNRK
jgi:CHASE2 domain-containing sensor protein